MKQKKNKTIHKKTIEKKKQKGGVNIKINFY